jgi:hypothetical protein
MDHAVASHLDDHACTFFIHIVTIIVIAIIMLDLAPLTAFNLGL